MNNDISAKYISPFLNNGPYSQSQFNNVNIDENLARAYSQLENLKQQQKSPERTVFTDISEEMAGMSEDERRFILSSSEYQKLNEQYQTEFSNFLINYFGKDYLRTEYGKTPEKILLLIKNKKTEYRSKFANDISEIKNQNDSLARKNADLEKTNLDLQAQLRQIQERLAGK